MERPSRAMISTFSPAATGADDRASQIAPSTKILPVGARAVRAATIWPTRTPAPVRSGSRFTASALNESSARIGPVGGENRTIKTLADILLMQTIGRATAALDAHLCGDRLSRGGTVSRDHHH